jgi:hypothetical protein
LSAYTPNNPSNREAGRTWKGSKGRLALSPWLTNDRCLRSRDGWSRRQDVIADRGPMSRLGIRPLVMMPTRLRRRLLSTRIQFAGIEISDRD